MFAKKSSDELLLISCNNADPFSTLIIDISSGSAIWGLKGHEFRSGNGCQDVTPLGMDGDFMMCTENEGKWLHIISINSKNRFHQVSHLNEPLDNMIVNNEGSMLFGTAGSKVYVWQISNGCLLALFDDHYQKITHIKISSDDTLLFTGSADGNVHVYSVTDLYSFYKNPNTKPTPLFEYRPHSLSITGMAITGGENPRIITCSDDHSLTIYSLSLKRVLLKVTADKPLKCCAIDLPESRLFVANDVGGVAIINLYDIENTTEKLIVTTGETTSVPILEGHEGYVTSMAINTDGSILATGDVLGGYRVWDIASKQTLKTSNMKSGVRTLKFVPNWESLHSTTYVLPKRKFTYFQRILGDPNGIITAVTDSSMDKSDLISKDKLGEIFDYYYEKALKDFKEMEGKTVDNDSENVQILRKEIERLKEEIKVLADQS
uniref:WD_REPEATS_REGION domain-containing protein n=1 Tax=Parastrongyloides trichosuri TaxID=131310 RepID=A0A0N4Z4M8_PARTI